MSVPLAYLGVIIIWSTTPLAIKWSGEDVGFLFGVTARMVIGVIVSALIISFFSRRIPWTREAIKVYFAAGIAIYGAMLCVYWGSQYISSGLISVIFGLNPIVTGIMASLWLNERSFSVYRIIGVLAGIIGLTVIFADSMQLNHQARFGIAAVFCSVLLHSGSAVWMKRLNSSLSALQVTHGALTISVCLYLLTWISIGGGFPQLVHTRAIAAIVYLGIFGSVLGFIMYFYILKKIEASRVALITLITPVLALFLGYSLNNEALNPAIWSGSALILFGMTLYHWNGKRIRLLRN